MTGDSKQRQGLALTDHRVLILGGLLILVTAALLVGHARLEATRPDAGAEGAVHGGAAEPELLVIEFDSIAAMERAFKDHEFDWPPEAPVPPLQVRTLPEGLDDTDPDQRKALFFRSLLPLVLAENARIRRERGRLIDAFRKDRLQPSSPEYAFVTQVAERYRLDGDVNDPELRARLLRRVDVIPVPLALAQAAKESGWGTSRFTREANNLFGVRTWEQASGVVPEQRPAGANHLVRTFPELRQSVRNYLITLNVGGAYSSLRALRAEMRAQAQPLDAIRLAEGLVRYSERGEEYVGELQDMIRANGLHDLGELRLAEGAN